MLSAASGPGGREGLRCLTCPRALARRRQLAPCLCRQALASAVPEAAAAAGRSCHPMCLQDREPNPVLGLTNSLEWTQQKATSVLWPGSPKLAAKPPTDKQFSRETHGLCSVPAAALLTSICRLQRDGCTQLCQSVSTSELTIAERQMTCYIFSYL